MNDNLSKTPSEAFLKAGVFSRKLKETLSKLKPSKTLGEIRTLVETEILGEGYKILFPVNINPGKILAHNSVSRDNSELVTGFTTIDFGFTDEKEVLIDTAVTVTHEDSKKLILEEYRSAFEKALRVIELKYKSQGYLNNYDISIILNECFAPLGTIVEECGGHVVEYPQLHKQIILQGCIKYTPLTGRLNPGTTFTIEPHIIPKNFNSKYKMNFSPSLIKKEGNFWVESAEFEPENEETMSLEKDCFYEEKIMYLSKVGEELSLTTIA